MAEGRINKPSNQVEINEKRNRCQESSNKVASNGKTKRKKYRVIHCKTTKEFNNKAQELMDGKLGHKVCVVLD